MELCGHFGVCGGCAYQDMDYSEELNRKSAFVINTFDGLIRDHKPEILPIMGSPKRTYYRNKLEYSFSNLRWITDQEKQSADKITDRNALGFHVKKRFNRVLDIHECYLQNGISNSLRDKVRSFCKEKGFSFYDVVKHTGFIRNLIIRTTSIGEVMTIVVFAEELVGKRVSLLEYIVGEFPQINSVMYAINSKANDSIWDIDVNLFDGEEYIIEKIGDFSYMIGPKTFFQPNIYQLNNLMKLIGDFAAFEPDKVVYDLYTGVGTIAIYHSASFKKCVGIDEVETSIEYARANAKANNINGNEHFIAGKVEKVLGTELTEKYGRPDIVVIDPPRAGMHEKVIKRLLEISPEKVVYVSCNPVSQVRDIKMLSDRYRITRIQAVDMLPLTRHVENVTLLIKR